MSCLGYSYLARTRSWEFRSWEFPSGAFPEGVTGTPEEL
jgi:hypothetical protein